MKTTRGTAGPNMAVAMRYRDVPGAIDWLCAAFGFARKTVVTGDTGTISYAQLTLGTAMIMLEPVGPTALDGFMKQPDEIGGAETQSCYFIVVDADAHCARSRAAGASIVSDIADFENGGRGYSCRDPEGHVWTFGTYDPWLGLEGAREEIPGRESRTGRRWAIGMAMLAGLAGAALAGAWIGEPWRQGASSAGSAMSTPSQAQTEPEVEARAVQAATALLAIEQSARESAQRSAREVGEQMALERGAREAAQREIQDMQRTAIAHQSAREAAERAASQAAGELERERALRQASDQQAQTLQQQAALQTGSTDAAERAEQTARDAREQAERQRSAKDAAERAARELQDRLSAEQGARARAERDAGEVREHLGRVQTARAAVQREVEDARRQTEEQRVAREAAELAAADARVKLEAEQIAKRVAWRLVGELRKQVAQLQRRAKSGEEAAAEPTAQPAAKPKQPQRKRRPPANASGE